MLFICSSCLAEARRASGAPILGRGFRWCNHNLVNQLSHHRHSLWISSTINGGNIVANKQESDKDAEWTTAAYKIAAIINIVETVFLPKMTSRDSKARKKQTLMKAQYIPLENARVVESDEFGIRDIAVTINRLDTPCIIRLYFQQSFDKVDSLHFKNINTLAVGIDLKGIDLPLSAESLRTIIDEDSKRKRWLNHKLQ